MKKAISLLLVIIMCSFLCGCNSGNMGNNYEPTTDEDKFAYSILKKAVPDYEGEDTNIASCGPCKVYENYNGATLVCVTLYDDNGISFGHRAYGLFEGTEIKEYIWFGTGISEMEELRTATDKLEYSEFDVSEDVCSAVGISTYREFCEKYATTMVCEYLIEYMNYLKNPYTIEINSVVCYVKPYGIYQAGSLDAMFFFTINYTAENNLGGKVTNTIGNTETAGLLTGSTSYIGSQFARSMYFVEDETYAKNQPGSFALDEETIQEHILKNY